MKQIQSQQHGFSLIEVLVAVLIFSLGLIGLAGLLVMSTQANQGAFLRTHVTFLGQNMADRMRANPIGVWQGDYDFTINPATASTAAVPACDSANPCSPAEVATHDVAQWGALLAQYLPADSALQASNVCVRPAGGMPISAAQLIMRPPYDGTCTMSIDWTERSLDISTNPAPQTFAWVFQP